MDSITIGGRRFFPLGEIGFLLGVTNVYRQVVLSERVFVTVNTSGGPQKKAYVSESEAARIISKSRKLSILEKERFFKDNEISATGVSCLQAQFGIVLRSVITGLCSLNEVFEEYVCYGVRLDFFIPRIRLNIEFDEDHHRTVKQIESDMKRDVMLATHGIKVIRVKADCPYDSMKEILQSAIPLTYYTLFEDSH